MRRAFGVLIGVLTLGLLAQPAFAPPKSVNTLGCNNNISADPSLHNPGLPATARSALSAVIGRDRAAYHAVAMRNGFRMKNPRSRLAAEFTQKGIQVRSGTSGRWMFSLQAYGEGRNLQPAATARPKATGNRVEYRRGTLIEWYVNGPEGLEQGFTVAKPPASGKGGMLTLAFSLSGNVKARINKAGTGLNLRGANGQAMLRYTGLAAHDETGRVLRSWLELRGSGLRIHVDASRARYPISVDPWVQAAELTATDSIDFSNLGYSVSVSADGSTVVAGAPTADINYKGAVYVFVKSSSDWANMTQVAKLTASDGGDGDQLGDSVSVSADGSTVVAGAFGAGISSNGFQGAAYVFVRPSTGWADETQAAKLIASDGQPNDGLGFSVSLSADGSTVVAGAPWAQIGSNVHQGAAYVFARPAPGWGNMAQSAKLTASDGRLDDFLGLSVSISADGSEVVAGMLGANGPLAGLQGAAYVFVKPATAWTNETQAAVLTASDGAYGDELGYPVNMSADGSTVVAGAADALIGSNSYQGAVYVFSKPAEGWTDETEAAKLTTSSQATHFLGVSVSVSASGSVVVAEVPLSDAFTSNDRGSAYIFVEPSGGWSVAKRPQNETARLAAAEDQYYGSFLTFLSQNLSVSADGLTVVAGSPDTGSLTGAAFVFSNADPFSQFAVHGFRLMDGPHPGFDMRANFAVAASGSSSINPMTQPVTLVLGCEVLALPAGAFHQNHRGNYVFSGVVEGVPIKAQIKVLGANRYQFVIKGDSANLAGIANPATIMLSIGDERGSALVNAVMH